MFISLNTTSPNVKVGVLQPVGIVMVCEAVAVLPQASLAVQVRTIVVAVGVVCAIVTVGLPSHKSVAVGVEAVGTACPHVKVKLTGTFANVGAVLS